MKRGLLVIVSLILFLTGLYILQSSKTDKSFLQINDPQADNQGGMGINASKEIIPDPFSELTIPYLRERAYTSKLGDLEQISSGTSYSSYLTSYDSDGLKINALLTRPGGDEPESGWPAIVFVHGYIPPAQYTTPGNYVAYIDYLARNGFVVFKIDLRGHGPSGGTPSGAYYSSDYIVDTLNAYSALQNTDFIDPKRIGLWGHSMGGNVVFRSIVVKKDIPAAVIWAGAVYTYEDMREYGISDNSYRPPATQSPSHEKRRKLYEKHGQFDPTNEFWKKVVPTNFLEGVITVLEIDHAVNDNVVSIEYSRNLQKILKDSPINLSVNEYPNGGHNIEGSSFNSAMQNTVNFFKSHL